MNETFQEEKQEMPKLSDMKSKETNEIIAAIAKVQVTMKTMKKDKENPFFNSKYADLTQIVEHVRPIMLKNGIILTQGTLVTQNGGIILVTELTHSTGQFLRSFYPVIADKKTPQGYGSAMTYARRYAFSSLLGIVVEDEDDDGNSAEGHVWKKKMNQEEIDSTFKPVIRK